MLSQWHGPENLVSTGEPASSGRTEQPASLSALEALGASFRPRDEEDDLVTSTTALLGLESTEQFSSSDRADQPASSGEQPASSGQAEQPASPPASEALVERDQQKLEKRE